MYETICLAAGVGVVSHLQEEEPSLPCFSPTGVKTVQSFPMLDTTAHYLNRTERGGGGVETPAERGICGTGVRAREIRGNIRRVRYTERDMWYRGESQGNKKEH